ncbi:MAG: ABC transporter ATP-binding protein [Chitinophagaceae bacterium]|nr:ABC transporter ATP-binding protein [Chitinophagaceae bacterium]
MQLRLAFSVAAHLEPEILLIDEVLAVGDIEFQKKCIGKMEEVSKSHGRTILFVSHNLDSLRKFCPITILLDKGRIIDQGSTEKIISLYVAKHLETNAEVTWQNGSQSYNNEVALYRTWLHDEKGQMRSRFDTTEKVGISMEYEVKKEELSFTHGINVFNQEQVNIFNSHDVADLNTDLRKRKGHYTTTAWIPGNLLPEGIFTISVALFLPNPLDILVHEQHKLSFEMFTDFSKRSARGNYADDFPGVVRPLLQWESTKTD